MTHKKSLLFFLVACLCLGGCDSAGPSQGEDPLPGGNGDDVSADVIPFDEGTRLSWDARTRQKIDERCGYSRMSHDANGDLVIGYDCGGTVYVRRSEDGGKTWSDRILVADEEGFIGVNSELLLLDNGDLLHTYNARPIGDSRRHALRVMVSEDNGQTWSRRATAYRTGTQESHGVYEPALIQLPNGDLHLYAANEYPFRPDGHEQLTMFWSSTDQGHTWSEGATLSYRQGNRDGMPNPQILKNDRGIAVVIEDNGWGGPFFKPTILWTPSVESPWEERPISGDSPNRWRALANDQQLDNSEAGAAPYLVQIPSGETVLSYQTTAGREGEGDPYHWVDMEVAIGNESAKNFTHKSRPYDIPNNEQAVWNALFVKDENTVTALTTTTGYSSGDYQELYIVDGRVIREPRLRRGEVTVDAQLDEDVWQKSSPIIAGSHSDKTAELRVAWDEEHLYLGGTAFTGGAFEGVNPDEFRALLTMSADTLTRDGPSENAFKLAVQLEDGQFQLSEGEGGEWSSLEDASAETAISGSETFSAPGFGGKKRTFEAKISWEHVGGKPENGEAWGINAGIAYDELGNSTQEWVSGTSGERPSSWLRVKLTE